MREDQTLDVFGTGSLGEARANQGLGNKVEEFVNLST